MLIAERRAYDQGKLGANEAKICNEEDTPLRWWNGFVAIVLVIVLVIVSIILTGRAKTIDLQKEAISQGLPPPPLSPQNMVGNTQCVRSANLCFSLLHALRLDHVPLPIRNAAHHPDIRSKRWGRAWRS